jgi:outer membrane biosynthesis protein TonB
VSLRGSGDAADHRAHVASRSTPPRRARRAPRRPDARLRAGGGSAVDSGTSGAVATIRGAAYSLPATDLLGAARTGVHDRGAYELGAAPADSPPATDPTPDPPADPTPDPAAPAGPTPDPAPPADPAPTHGHAPRPKPKPPVSPAEPAPAPSPPRLGGVTVPPVVHPVSSARLRAALRACDTRHGASARARCRDAAIARLRPSVRFSLDRAATVTVTVATDAARSRELGHTTVAARRGANTVAFAAGAGRRGLRPGRYRVTLTAVAGGRSAAAVQTVTVRRG